MVLTPSSSYSIFCSSGELVYLPHSLPKPLVRQVAQSLPSVGACPEIRLQIGSSLSKAANDTLAMLLTWTQSQANALANSLL